MSITEQNWQQDYLDLHEMYTKAAAERDAFLEARTSLIEENGRLYDEIADLRHALAKCVASLDQLLPYLAKVPADVGLLSDALVAARPLLDGTKQHPDDEAVYRFAVAMKVKLAAARAKGRGGWENKDLVSDDRLAEMLVEHLGKGNAGTFEDVANFSMMLHQRGADPMVLAEAAEAPIKKARGEAQELGVRALESKSEHTEPAPAQDEREAFEAWMVEVEGARIRPRFDRVTAGPFADEYRDGQIQGAWNVWQASAARQLSPAGRIRT